MRFLCLAFFLASCANSRIAIEPRWDAHIYAGSSAAGGVTRTQSAEVIKPGENGFEDLRCVKAPDLDRLFVILQQCREWRAILEVDRLFE